ncbi:hypothetical protein BH10ACI1_BH10ACI1_32560 [soil metagenome]
MLKLLRLEELNLDLYKSLKKNDLFLKIEKYGGF